MDIPDTLQEHYNAKSRPVPRTPSPVAPLLRTLDDAIIDYLHHGGAQEAIDAAMDAVLQHPESTWNRDTLQYRIRVLHYS